MEWPIILSGEITHNGKIVTAQVDTSDTEAWWTYTHNDRVVDVQFCDSGNGAEYCWYPGSVETNASNTWKIPPHYAASWQQAHQEALDWLTTDEGH